VWRKAGLKQTSRRRRLPEKAAQANTLRKKVSRPFWRPLHPGGPACGRVPPGLAEAFFEPLRRNLRRLAHAPPCAEAPAELAVHPGVMRGEPHVAAGPLRISSSTMRFRRLASLPEKRKGRRPFVERRLPSARVCPTVLREAARPFPAGLERAPGRPPKSGLDRSPPPRPRRRGSVGVAGRPGPPPGRPRSSR